MKNKLFKLVAVFLAVNVLPLQAQVSNLLFSTPSGSTGRVERMPAAIKPRPQPTPVGDFARISLNHQRQEKNMCVPTSASIMLNKFGQNYTPRHIKTLSSGGNYNPSLPFVDFTTTNYNTLLFGLKRVGISWHLAHFSNDSKGFKEGMTRIKNSIKFGYPVMVSIALGPGNGHCVVVCGYNDNTKRITFVDPAMPAPGIIEYSYEHFEIAYWNRFTSFGENRRLAVFMYQ